MMSNFEVIRPQSYNYDVIIKNDNDQLQQHQQQINSLQQNQTLQQQQQQTSNNMQPLAMSINRNNTSDLNSLPMMVHSHYGLYYGPLNEKKHKDGKGTFIFSNSIYTGQWKDDKREGEGTLVMSDGFANDEVKQPQPQLQQNNNLSTSTSFRDVKYHQQQQQQHHRQSFSSTNNSSLSSSKDALVRIENTFNQLENKVVLQQDDQYLSSHDYYSGKWQASKANGLGTFHFKKDNSSHQDFWRCGLVIRYVNRNNILLPLTEESLVSSFSDSKEILKEMIEDWKRVIGTDEDFPSSKPFLSMPTTGSTNLSISQLNSNGTSTTPSSPGGGTSTLLDNLTMNETKVLSSSVTTPSLLQHSYTQPSFSQQSQQPSLTNSFNQQMQQRNQLLLQQKKNVKQSFGVITASYIKNRLETEEKFFVPLIFFISKWEIPLKSFSISNTNSNFLIVIPDTDSATFVPLSNLMMQSNILDRLISKVLTTDNSIIKNNNTVPSSPITAFNNSTIMEEDNLGASTTTTSTSEERELYKLFPVCLDIDEDEDIQKRNIHNIISKLKEFPKQQQSPDGTPPIFLIQQICQIISIFKKTRPLESHLLSKQFSIAKNYFFKPPAAAGEKPSRANTTTTTSPDSLSPPMSSLGVAAPKNVSTSAPVSPNGKVVPVEPFSSPSGKNTPLSTTNAPSGKPSSKSNLSITTSSKLESKDNGKNSTNQTTTAVTVSKPTPNYHKAFESIHQFKQQSKTDLLSALMEPSSSANNNNNGADEEHPQINSQTINVLFNLFKSTYQFPQSLEDSVSYLRSIQENLENMKNIVEKKINFIKEALSRDADYYSLRELNSGSVDKHNIVGLYKDYLKSKDDQIGNFVNELQKDIDLFDKSYSTCQELCTILYSYQILLIIKRLRNATQFIQQFKKLLDEKKQSGSPVPKDGIIKFVRHIFKITEHLLYSFNQQKSFIKLDDVIKDSIQTFINNSSELFGLLKNNNASNNGNSASGNHENQGLSSPPSNSAVSVNVSGTSPPEKSNSTQSLTSLITSNLVGFVFNNKKSPPSPIYTSFSNSLGFGSGSNSGNGNGNLPQLQKIGPINTSHIFEPSDISPGPFSFISPLNKIPEEIKSGNYHLIIPIASSGDEQLVAFLSQSLLDLRTNLLSLESLKTLEKSKIINLFNVLLHSAVLCPFKFFRSDVFKTISPLLAFYSKKDELFIRFKEIFKTFFEITFKEQYDGVSVTFGAQFCMFLASLYKGLNSKLKKDFVDTFPIEKLIDLMERPYNTDTKPCDSIKAQAAQVLINLSISSFNNLTEIKNRGGLASILELCKLGQVFAHTQIDESELKIAEFLGAGALARVNKATWNGKEVAVKIFNEGSYSFRLEDFLKEVAIMGLINHPNLLKLEGACITPRATESTFMIVTELMHKGTLFDVIKKNKPLPVQTIVKHALSVAYGLSYLHSIDLIHRDIKASNILVDMNDNSKVGDFGLSRVVNSFNMTSNAGTPKWESPECLAGEAYTSAADVYSYGMTLVELITGDEPFPEIQTIVELFRVVYEKKLRPKLPSSTPHFLSSLVKDCLSHTPKKRPTITQIISRLHENSADQKITPNLN
ncbi:hypothetical protein CYY_005960 [Polysphondylium violaceum]|uniref:Protein kinase domain-containing protein n=1 Tax=Polysphondylium violaceum TaxID=133409 RepID=A0A8J4V6D3_9MYCE|nr:hypothetical protein CYY_005960 [Polysphondylium violaceum]